MTPLDEKQVVQLIDDAFDRYRGNVNELKGAIGAFMLGRIIGWKPLMLMQDKRSIEKYERIMGVSFRDVCPEVGAKAERSHAWKAMQKVRNFWKAVKGEIAGVRSPEVL